MDAELVKTTAKPAMEALDGLIKHFEVDMGMNYSVSPFQQYLPPPEEKVEVIVKE